jgi:dihydropteroate synthase
MGILNVTPDSFADGGRYVGLAEAVQHGLEMVDEGADLLDIGGESTRPGAPPVEPQVEIDRVLPVVETLRHETEKPISVDTRRAVVARAALAAGANIINDISGLADPGMADVAAAADAGLVIMHSQGEPRTMQLDPQYDDVLTEICAHLRERAAQARAAGVRDGRIVVDPGIGFGKTLAHNLTILRNLDRLCALGFPLLIGVSRKAFIGSLSGAPVENRLPGTLAALTLAIAAGARIVRVHDVAPAVQAAAVAEALRR